MLRFFILGPWKNESLRLTFEARIERRNDALLLREPKSSDVIVIEEEEDRNKLSKGFRSRAITVAQIKMLAEDMGDLCD